MRVFKVICCLILGPSSGTVSGLLVGAAMLSPGDYSAPGDGFMILFWMAAGFAISTLASVMLARWIWKRSVPAQK